MKWKKEYKLLNIKIRFMEVGIGFFDLIYYFIYMLGYLDLI